MPNTARIIITAPLTTIERLAGDEYLRKATAQAIRFECPEQGFTSWQLIFREKHA